MKESYSIERANNSNIEELLILSKKVSNHNSREFLSDEKVDAFLDSEYFRNEVINQIKNMTVIKNKNSIIGFCVWKKEELVSFMVDLNHQGKGVAKYFLETISNQKFRKYDELKLLCFKDNIRANKFYKKLNWELKETFLNEDLGLFQNVYIKRVFKDL